ncbi:MAG: YD repeat-containing protein [Parcubacteria group bacterium Athens0714_16]|nr:MAG: YD repeat-containing protein [Parcubacteria group bacterium Athens0714_16]
MFTKNQIISAIKITTMSAILIVGLNYANAAWSGPTASAPSGGIPTPVNLSSINQIKNGSLGVNALSVFGDGLFNRDMTAEQFCLNGCCISSWSDKTCGTPVFTPPSTPVVSLSASPTSVAYNDSSVLTWTSTNTTSCSANWTSSTATSGSTTKSNLTSTTAYAITCTGTGGSQSASVTVDVDEAPVVSPVPVALTLIMTATGGGSTISTNAWDYPTLYIDYWDSADISWSSTGASECSKGGSLIDKNGNTTLKGTDILEKELFTILCRNSSGKSVSKNIWIYIKGPGISFDVQPHLVNIGDTVTFTWSSGSTATYCGGNEAWSNAKTTWWFGPYNGDTSGSKSAEITQAVVDANKLYGSNPWYLAVGLKCCNNYGGCSFDSTWIRPK